MTIDHYRAWLRFYCYNLFDPMGQAAGLEGPWRQLWGQQHCVNFCKGNNGVWRSSSMWSCVRLDAPSTLHKLQEHTFLHTPPQTSTHPILKRASNFHSTSDIIYATPSACNPDDLLSKIQINTAILSPTWLWKGSLKFTSLYWAFGQV